MSRTGQQLATKWTVAIVALGTVPLGLAWRWMTGSGVITSSIFAGLWGIGMVWFLVGTQGRMAKNPPEMPGENVVYLSPANHFRGAEGVGGWLVLTDMRLAFKPHRLNVQRDEWSLPLSRVQSLEPRTTAWLIPNGLRAVTAHGEERFVVNDRAGWVQAFRSLRDADSPKV